MENTVKVAELLEIEQLIADRFRTDCLLCEKLCGVAARVKNGASLAPGVPAQIRALTVAAAALKIEDERLEGVMLEAVPCQGPSM